ncbi:hypothetical protein [Brevibacillus borstelensis]|uniref:hypothetical protein n=1 Tax=Brevibacillus borstelensis TaxID=45462 RepID=UPI002E1B39CE|nr:hypothetical protein [Brevibacillus borstelensis]
MRLTKFKSLFASLLCGALVLSAAGLSTHAADGVQKVQLKLTSVEIELTPEVFLASKKCSKWQLKMYHLPTPKLFTV